MTSLLIRVLTRLYVGMPVRLGATGVGILIGGSALASVVTITDSYVLGDGDSKVSARQTVLDHIKTKAVDQAGSYVEHDKNLNADGELSQKVRILTAAMVKVTPLTERIKTNQTGAVTLEITAKVMVDDAELQKRVAALQSDARKDERISGLQTANLALHAKLDAVYQELHAKALNLDDLSALLKQQVDLAEEIDANENSVRDVFEAGSLLRIAETKRIQSDSVRKQFALDYIDAWKQLSAKLRPTISSVEEVGNKIEVVVAVPDLPSKYNVVNRLLGGKAALNSGHKWMTSEDMLRYNEVIRRELVDKMIVINRMPVMLRVTLFGEHAFDPPSSVPITTEELRILLRDHNEPDRSTRSTQYFGIGSTGSGHRDQDLSPGKLNERYGSAIIEGENMPQAVGFIEEKFSQSRLKEDIFYFRFVLSKKQATTAGSVNAQFVVMGT